ncbi:hypothetical protein, partial [Klebsiella pneumoniae]|uniref:hypothetical protein n=1 Tax=Klebsiella pneumoniae TaxID=573 RepID=UPI003EE24D3B
MSDQAGGAGQGATLLVITAHPDPALPDALRNYSASYGQAAVVYIDPFSFESRDRRILQAAADRFL